MKRVPMALVVALIVAGVVAAVGPRLTVAQPAGAAKQAGYPEKGRVITILVAYAPGGSIDIAARMLAPMLEAQLGVPVQVVNKPGAAAQVGTTELALSRPDGYTIGYLSIPASSLPYLDPDRKAVYGRRNLQPVMMLVVDPDTIMVKADSHYKTVKDLLEAARARPGQITVGTSGAMGPNHLAILLLQKAAGVKFRTVHFDGAGPAATALLGGHIEALDVTAGSAARHFKSGAIRYLAIMDKEETRLYPGVPTLESQGYKVSFGTSRGIVVPGGTPRDVVEVLERALKQITASPEYRRKMDEVGLPQRNLDSAAFSAYWDENGAQTKLVLGEAKAELAR